MQRKNEQPRPLKTTDDRRKKGKKPVNTTVNLETEQEQAGKSFRSSEMSPKEKLLFNNISLAGGRGGTDRVEMVSGSNCGQVDLNDVSQIQMQGKNDVMLELPVDDTSLGILIVTNSEQNLAYKDSLMEMSFHIPDSNTQFIGDDNHPPAQVFCDKIKSMADVDAGGEGVVVTFDGIAIFTPRGRYNVEVHLSFLRLQGQADDFKIQYSSVLGLFLLPKSNQPHTFVVVTLDAPICKAQTLYPHIVLQFETDYVVRMELSISEDLLNTKYKNKLESSDKGLIHEVFTTILRALSGAKVIKPGKFRSAQGHYGVRSSLKSKAGVLYPLEKCFFFLPNPPTLNLNGEVDHVEFERHAAGGSNMHYFDLLIRLKNEQEHLFWKIQMNEYDNLLDFISSKCLMASNTLRMGVEGDRGFDGQDGYYISKLNALRVEMQNKFACVHNEFACVHNEFARINAKIDMLTDLMRKYVERFQDE